MYAHVLVDKPAREGSALDHTSTVVEDVLSTRVCRSAVALLHTLAVDRIIFHAGASHRDRLLRRLLLVVVKPGALRGLGSSAVPVADRHVEAAVAGLARPTGVDFAIEALELDKP